MRLHPWRSRWSVIWPVQLPSHLPKHWPLYLPRMTDHSFNTFLHTKHFASYWQLYHFTWSSMN
jgi:hypothetical protein